MMNTSNFGILKGRLADEVKVFDNKDGSRKIMFKLAVNDNFKGKNGERKTHFIPLETIISKAKDTNGVYDYINKGDKVTVQYSIRNNNYEKDGVMHYGITLFAESVNLEETKTEKIKRLNKAKKEVA